MRDDFTKATIDILAKRVGQRCSNPSCRKTTSGPHTDSLKSVIVGVAAHVTAASPGGPRYDPDLTSADRSSIGNAIWLCQTCSKLVDSDEGRFAVEVLRKWKEQAESVASEEIESRTEFSLTATVREGFDQIRATQRDSLVKQAEATDEIKAQVGRGFSDVERTVSSMPNLLLASLSTLHDNLLELARGYLNDNKPAQALDYLEQQKKPLWSNATSQVKARLLVAMGIAQLRLANERRAAELFLEALQYDPDDEKTLCNAAVGYFLLEDLTKARELAHTVLASSFHEKLYNRFSVHTSPVAPAAPPRHRAFLAAAPAAGAPPDAR